MSRVIKGKEMKWSKRSNKLRTRGLRRYKNVRMKALAMVSSVRKKTEKAEGTKKVKKMVIWKIVRLKD
jgi:hypothetical protein